MENNDIDKILEPIYKVFLTNNFVSVSRPKLEIASGLPHGELFSTYKSKDAIFAMVVDRYILDFLSLNMSTTNDITLKDYINSFLNRLTTRVHSMRLLGIKNVHCGFFNLMYEAEKYYPDFEQKISLLFKNHLERWTVIVDKALSTGEIESKREAKDIAQHFHYLFMGMIFEQSLYKGIDIDQLRMAYDEYYESMVKE